MSTVQTTSPAVEGEVIEHIDPNMLTLATNVRRSADLTPGFLASIAEVGVLEPVTAYRAQDGTLVVLRGQRRTLAAREVNRPSVPVRVVAQPDEAERIVDQATENVHRQEMRRSDLVLAIQDLTNLGESEAKISKRLGVKREQVKSLRSASRDDNALKALDKGRLSFEDAALIAEFDDDPETVAELLELPSWQRQRAAIKARRRALEAQAWEAEAQVHAAQGWTVLPHGTEPSTQGEGILSLAAYVDAQGEPAVVTEQTPRDALALALIPEWAQTEQDETLTWSPEVAVLAPDRAGWVTVTAWREQHGHLPAEAEVVAAAAVEAEAKRAERREVVTRNKEWEAATEARRAWFATWAKGRKAPAGAEKFILRAMCDSTILHALSHKGAPDLVKVLNPKRDHISYGASFGDLAQRADKATPTAATMLTAAALVAAWEARVTREAWRNPQRADALVMGALIDWGYPATEVERLLVRRK